jgi:hypothetical protein
VPLPVGAPIAPQQGGGPLGITFDVPKAWWIDPRGGVWPLMDTTAGWWTIDAGVKGMDAVAPVVFTNDNVPRGGTQVRWIQPDARTITWPLRVEGRTHATFKKRWRDLARAFTSTRRLGPGQLLVSRPDGSARQIDAYYQEGFEEAGIALGGRNFEHPVLTLYCPDPYWQDLYPTEVERHYQGTGTPIPYQGNGTVGFPFVSSSLILGDTIVENPGDVETWPEWTITGPAAGITVTNNTTGISWSLDPSAVLARDLAAGEVITIKGNPPQISGPTGAVWETAIDWTTSDLWWLEPGFNDVTLSVSEPGTGTSILMSYYGRYETA